MLEDAIEVMQARIRIAIPKPFHNGSQLGDNSMAGLRLLREPRSIVHSH